MTGQGKEAAGAAAGAVACAPPDSNPRGPRTRLPAGSCDCHAHICGPTARHPYAAERVYSPPDAVLGDYQRLLAALGAERAVLVQPSFYGTDNGAMLEAMGAAGPGFRGVAVVPDGIADDALADLDRAGVRGIRFNVVDVRHGAGRLPLARVRRLAERVRPFGWHVEFLMHVDQFPELDNLLAGFPVDVVFGHLGYVRPGPGTGAPGFQALLRLLRTGRAWVKLTGPYRISATGLPYGDVDEFAEALIAAAPDRLIWGSDWPHVKAQWSEPMPNDGDLVDVVGRWIADRDLLKRIMVDNPSKLYRFD